ncbi:MAG: FAD-dependent oxidoreductase [Lentisphaeria bacterium]|nr:FAD-dependent oxidoreductase [Lentisphaeria bacterium]
MKKYDVIVAGAGSAGFGAAMGAARMGKKVLLFDSNASPGGITVYAGCPVFTANAATATLPRRGIYKEFISALEGKYISPNGDHSCNTFETDIVLLMTRMLSAAGVDMLFYATLIDVETFGEKIRNVTLFSCGQKLVFEADHFVDATGDATLADLAGAPTVTASRSDSMTKTLLFRVNNVTSFDKARIKELFPTLEFPYPWQDNFMGTPLGDGKDILINLSAVAGDALDPFDRTRMDMELREQVETIHDWLRRKVPGFENCRISAAAPSIGVRCSRNILGKEQITCCDLDENTPVEEPVAFSKRFYGDHFVDRFRSPWGKFPGGLRPIPYGTLLAQKLTNLTVGGRCISVESRAVTSIRLAPCCMMTGEIAGIAAAMGIPSYADLKEELKKQDLF